MTGEKFLGSSPDTTMDFSSHSKHRIGVIWPLEYSDVAGIALFQVVSGEKANSILSYKHRIKCRIRVYFSPEIERYTMSYRAIGLNAVKVFVFDFDPPRHLGGSRSLVYGQERCHSSRLSVHRTDFVK
jgi:hypothetical protein